MGIRGGFERRIRKFMAGLNQVRTEVIAVLYHNECKSNIHNKGWIRGLVIYGMKTIPHVSQKYF
jgi:hypothetical protein